MQRKVNKSGYLIIFWRLMSIGFIILKMAKLYWQLIIILFPLILLFSYPIKINAEDNINPLLINELYPNPETGESEWIELYNSSSGNISLDGFYITDNTGINHKLIIDKYIVASKSYLVLEDLSFVMNNDSDSITLYDNFGKVIDQVNYGNVKLNPTNAPVPEKGKSITRIDGKENSGKNCDDFIIADPTKNAPYIKYSDKIKFSELSLKSESNKSFIELYNEGEEPIDLTNWVLDDSKNIFSLSGYTINQKQYLVFQKSLINFDLPEKNGLLLLKNPNGEIENKIKYDQFDVTLSYSLIDGIFKFTEVFTPGIANVFQEKAITSEQNVIANLLSISLIKNLKIGDTLSVKGTVTVSPGVLSEHYFYIQDESGGIQVYCYYSFTKTITSGDIIQLTGELSQTGGELRVKIKNESDIIILSRNKETIIPKEVAEKEINDDLVGSIVKMEGTVINSSGSEFNIKVGEKEIKVIYRNELKNNRIKVKKGDNVEVIGILSVYKGSFRILPITENDVKIIDHETLPLAGIDFFFYLDYALIYYLVIVIWNIYQKAKKKHLLWQKKLPANPLRAIF